MNRKDEVCAGRRNAMKTMIALSSVLSAPFVWTPARTAPQHITVRDPGGVVAQMYQKVFYAPFTQATGIQVISAASGPEPTAQIRTMVETKRYLWDMATSITQFAVLNLTTDKVYLERHGLDDDPIISAIPPQFRSPYSIGANVYATVLAYRTDVFKGRRAPAAWKDLWDINHFPGRRSLRQHPFDTIEIALMADGVLPGEVYPCDLDRAFCSLDKIKPHIDVWWTTGPQTAQLLISGEVDVMPVWIVHAQSAIDAHVPITICENQHLYGVTNWVILKGTPHADACRQLIRFASDPKRQALLAPYGAFGPTQPDAFHYIDAQYAKRLPSYPDHLKKGLLIDAAYWAKQQTATEQFNHWLVN